MKVTGPDEPNPITDEQIRALRAERRTRRRGGTATFGQVMQHFPPLRWERVATGIYHGSRRGWLREYSIRREGAWGWRVYRAYAGGEHLASCSTYRGSKQWTQLLADGPRRCHRQDDHGRTDPPVARDVQAFAEGRDGDSTRHPQSLRHRVVKHVAEQRSQRSPRSLRRDPQRAHRSLLVMARPAKDARGPG